jgi:hypothetical protein
MQDPPFSAVFIFTLYQEGNSSQAVNFFNQCAKVPRDQRLQAVSFISEVLPKMDCETSDDLQSLSNTIRSGDQTNNVFRVLFSYLSPESDEETVLKVFETLTRFCSQNGKRLLLRRFLVTQSERDSLIANLENITSEAILKSFLIFLDLLTEKTNLDLLEAIMDHANNIIISGKEPAHGIWSTVSDRIKNCCSSSHPKFEMREVVQKPQSISDILKETKQNSRPHPIEILELKTVSVNLTQLSHEFFGSSFNMQQELSVLQPGQEPSTETKSKTIIQLRRKEDVQQSFPQHSRGYSKRLSVNSSSGQKRPSMTRGGSSLHHRHSNSNAGRIDSFRSRPPNTSRPPSMHVDDFVAREQQSSTPCSSGQQQPKLTKGGTPSSLRGKQAVRSSPLLGKRYHSSSPKRFKP